jgi:glycosyltransferase involved in cell wall biosynthesis
MPQQYASSPHNPGVRVLHLTDRVTDRGGAHRHLLFPHERLPRLLRRARALLMPSRWQEPFGIAGLEALSLGVPVVAWESGGIREWHAGPLVAWGDVAGLARALRAVIGSTASPPAGFAPAPLMDRLERVYAGAAPA